MSDERDGRDRILLRLEAHDADALGGAAEASSRLGSQPLWKNIQDGVRRESLQDALDIMNQAAGRLEPQICLCTNSFIRQIMKLGRDQIGGNMAEDTLVKGWSSSEFMKCKWVSTVKYELIPRNRLHMMADNEYIGKSFVLDDVSLYVKREEQWLEFYMFETIGLTIANGYGLATEIAHAAGLRAHELLTLARRDERAADGRGDRRPQDHRHAARRAVRFQSFLLYK